MMKSRSSIDFDERKAATSLIGTIRVDTNEVQFYAFRANSSEVVKSYRVPLSNEQTGRGWLEQSPEKIIAAVRTCIDHTAAAGKVMGVPVIGVSVVNQRGSVMAWNKRTGAPLANVILWSDSRSRNAVNGYIRKYGKYKFQKICGLPFATCFSAFNIKWLTDNNAAVRTALKQDVCYFGTVDSWLVWNLTGGKRGGVFATDTTNAAFTFLMNINTLAWDKKLMKFFGVPAGCLPDIKATTNSFGKISDGPLEGVLITGVMGNRQADLVANRCVRPGMTTAVLDGSGSVFVVTGENAVFSKNGLLTTIAHNFDSRPTYALEGLIAVVGEALEYTTRIFRVRDTECSAVTSTEGGRPVIYHVPAAYGLFAPHWELDARILYHGIELVSTRDDFVRSSMNCVAHQVQDIVEAISNGLNVKVKKIIVCGYVSNHKYSMQMLSDITRAHIDVVKYDELSAFGGAIAAGYSPRLNVSSVMCLPDFDIKSYVPKMTNQERSKRILQWNKAVNRSCGWIILKDNSDSYWYYVLFGGVIVLGVYLWKNRFQT